ncbi:MAG TPA: hypothetical protein VEQ59_18465 [Polyangiaceae bacterium]|nr:hypothetical protein [Polyangiaceae bacterium]
MKKSPVAVVKERFASKDKLVEAVQKLATADLWIDRVNGTKGFAKVSNQKLVKLHDTLTDAQKRFGSRDKLISAILELKKRTKDAGYAAGLKKAPLPQLLDLHASIEHAGKRAAAKAAAKTAPKSAKKAAAPVAKKAAATKAPAKKAPSKKR